MTEVFDNRCLRHNIEDGGAQDEIAHLIMLLFQGGARTVEDLEAGLDRLRAN